MNNIAHIAAWGLGGVALVALAATAFSEKPRLVPYVLHTDKVKNPVRLLHVSDLHSSGYGPEQAILVALTEELAPDAILMTGDIADNRVPNRNAFTYTRAVGKRYPCFYVTGNHERYTGHIDALRQIFRSHGLTLLAGDTVSLTVGDTTLSVSGIDDPYCFPDDRMRLWEDQLYDANAGVSKERFSLLLTHRPERVGDYVTTDFDLILAGHAHGGQVILPGLVNGLYAPHQGVLPAYAGGHYSLREGQTMIVSRGLSKYVRPRVFNRPEFVLITLLPISDCSQETL